METEAHVVHVLDSDNVNGSVGRTCRKRECAVSSSKGQMWLATDAMGIAMNDRSLKIPPKLRRHMYTDRELAKPYNL